MLGLDVGLPAIKSLNRQHSLIWALFKKYGELVW